MKNIREEIRKKRLYFDGGFGTLLQAMGLPAGTPPEIWNLTEPDRIISVHRSYVEAGCNFLTTNTFGATSLRFGPELPAIIRAGVRLAKEATQEAGHGWVAFDMGPTGKLLAPYGELPFEEAVSAYREAARLGAGEILLTSMDADGTKAGYDLELTAAVSGRAGPTAVIFPPSSSTQQFSPANPPDSGA